MNPFHTHQSMHITSIQLLIKHIPRSLEFYHGILGFQILRQDDHQVELTANGCDAMITLIKDDHAIPLSITQGLYHVAFLLPNRGLLADIIKRLAEQRYPISGASDHGVSEAIYLDDPDGNGIEIYSDREQKDWPYVGDQLEMYTKKLDIDHLMQEASHRPYTHIHPDTIIGHLHFHVPQLKQAEDFYCKILGFVPTMLYMKSALFVSDGGYHHHLGLNIWNGDAPLRKERQVGLIGYTLHVPKNEYIDLTNRLRDAHISIMIDDQRLYIIDPVGQQCYLEVS